MTCPNIDRNTEWCTCPSTDCSRKGTCCECIHTHLQNGSLPMCVRPLAAELAKKQS